MLRREIHLVNKQELRHFSMFFIFSPAIKVVLDGHGTVLFDNFFNCHVLCICRHVESAVFKFSLAHHFGKFFVIYVRFVKGTLNELSLIEFASFSVERGLLSVISNPHICCTVGAIEHNKWTTIASIETRMLSVTELVIFPDRIC